jgi:protein CpxP
MNMKNMIKMKMVRAAAVALCGAGLIVGAAFAQQDGVPPPADGQQQGPPSGGHRGWDSQRRVEMMQHHLNLTADQMAQVKSILDENRSKMEAMYAETSLTPQDRRAQSYALRQDTNAKIRAVLTPDQQTKFDEVQARQREHHRGGPEEKAEPSPAPQPQQ